MLSPDANLIPPQVHSAAPDEVTAPEEVEELEEVEEFEEVEEVEAAELIPMVDPGDDAGGLAGATAGEEISGPEGVDEPSAEEAPEVSDGEATRERGLVPVGRRIRERRLMKGMSLAELSAATKVPVEQLERLEEGREDELPGPVFVKGFIRCCARDLDFDADAFIEVLDASEELMRPSAAAERLRRSQAFARELTASLPVVGRRRVIFFGVLALLVLLVVFFALSRASLGPAMQS